MLIYILKCMWKIIGYLSNNVSRETCVMVIFKGDYMSRKLEDVFFQILIVILLKLAMERIMC